MSNNELLFIAAFACLVCFLATVGLVAIAKTLGKHAQAWRATKNREHSRFHLLTWIRRANRKYNNVDIEFVGGDLCEITFKRYGVTVSASCDAFDTAGGWRDEMATSLQFARLKHRQVITLVGAIRKRESVELGLN